MKQYTCINIIIILIINQIFLIENFDLFRLLNINTYATSFGNTVEAVIRKTLGPR